VVELGKRVKVEYRSYRGLLSLVVSFINPHSYILIPPRSYCCLPAGIGETDSIVESRTFPPPLLVFTLSVIRNTNPLKKNPAMSEDVTPGRRRT
jgi:hypothetical protein